jgi:transcriptional regulator with XRE-family HTH domain
MASPKFPYKRIGEKVKLAREKEGLSQEEMASKLGFQSRLSLSRIENGQKSPYRKITEIARITRRPVSWFLEENKELDALLWKALQYDILVAHIQKTIMPK